MSQYTVELHCPCGELHSFVRILMENGPDRAGTVAELGPDGKLPPVVASKLHDAVWCDTLGEYVIVGSGGPDKVTIRLAAGLFGQWVRA